MWGGGLGPNSGGMPSEPMGGAGGLVGKGVVVGGVLLVENKYGAGVDTYTGLPFLFKATLILNGLPKVWGFNFGKALG